MKPIEKRIRSVEIIKEFKPRYSKSRQKAILKESKAKSISSLISSRITIMKKDYKYCMNTKLFTPNDIILLLEMISQKNREFKGMKSKFIEIEIVEGWKGKLSLEIFEDGFDQDFKIIQNIRDKETMNIEQTTKIIPAENVNRILKYISTWKIGESHKCYDFAEIVGEKNWKEVWKKRTDVYFPLYYFPIKVLEALKIIKYSGKGIITRKF